MSKNTAKKKDQLPFYFTRAQADKGNDSKLLKVASFKPSNDNKIINGVAATRIQYPFITQLFYRESESFGFSFSCTASLISDQWVLTAAHCLSNSKRELKNPANFRVAVGKPQLVTGDDIEKQYTVTTIGTFGYKGKSFLDLGLMKLGNPVPSSEATPARIYVSPVQTGLPVTVAGFGVTEYGSSVPSSVLLQTKVDISESSNCSTMNKNWESNTGPQLCQESYNGDDSCQGDSGGPLVTNIDGENVIVGVTNSGGNKDKNSKNLCGYNVIAYYARLGYYASAISKVIGVPLSTLAAA
ncbi:hypothetical protein BB560_006305 [Smittium megazygosporum]|uniref:Peptidase S1 domain-containing protein n=1 Tax=Smittium megazygosporum TaxID=133381 RepID=A0A2T9YAG4_9FUNG|nr:hypothetical protein BB560_006305 [Smittium megazygosporum]